MRYITINVDIDIQAVDETEGEERVKAVLDKVYPSEYTIRDTSDHGEAE